MDETRRIAANVTRLKQNIAANSRPWTDQELEDEIELQLYLVSQDALWTAASAICEHCNDSVVYHQEGGHYVPGFGGITWKLCPAKPIHDIRLKAMFERYPRIK